MGAPIFDAKAAADAWTKGVRKPDGRPYSAFAKFPPWKRWSEDAVLDLEKRVAALEAQPRPFP